jgi:methionyl-tRNA formyltransferase
MRTVLLANNRLGAEVGRYLAERGDLIGLVVHPESRRKHGPDLTDLDAPSWEWPDGLEAVRTLRPDCLLSVLFGYLVPSSWLEIPRWRALNLHPGLLPWNGGCFPNVWPIVDGSPAGTTLHVMEPGFDTGAVVAQRAVPTYGDDTARTLYERLEAASLLMFRSVWPGVGDISPQPQQGGGSYHRLGDLAELDPRAEDLDLIDRLRARTFAPHGAEFTRDGRRYRVRVEIEQLE